jgi:hypothetical protein
VEEETPHVEESTGQRDPKIPAARESPETVLIRGWWRFGERGSGWKNMPKGIFTPTPPFID